MARFSGLTRGLSNDRHPKLGVGQLPAAVVINSSTVAGAAAPLTISKAANSFAGTIDPTQYLGYNMTADGARPISGEPGLAWGVEGNYNDGSGANKMESYLQFGSADGLVTRRPLMIQINRTTKQVSQFSQSAPIFTWISGDDTAGTGGTAAMTLTGTTGGGSGGVLNFGSASHDFALQVNAHAIAHLYDNPLGATGAALYVGTGGGDNSAVGVFDVSGSNTGVKGLVVRGRGSQAANLLEVQDSTPNVLFSVSPAGIVQTRSGAVDIASVGANRMYVGDLTPIIGGDAGIAFGGPLDTQLYRVAASQLVTSGGLGMFNVTPPSSKPATPASTATAIITLLQSYGMCA